MGYLIKATLGLGLFFGAIVLFNVKLIELLETGTCASGNTPYEISRPCPEGTGMDMLLLTGSIFAGMAGTFLFAVRGTPPWGERSTPPMGDFNYALFAWGIFFTATGATATYALLTNEALGPDAELGGGIVGILFLIMGVPPLLYALWGLIKPAM